MKNRILRKIRDLPFVVLGWAFLLVSVSFMLLFFQPIIWLVTDRGWKECAQDAIGFGVYLAFFLQLPFVGWVITRTCEGDDRE